MPNLYSVVDQIKPLKQVLLGFSGKDSLVCLDLLIKAGVIVKPFFMYFISDLSWQEGYLRQIESKYNLSILRVPHWQLGGMYREGVLRGRTVEAAKTPRTTLADLEALVRKRLNCLDTYIAYGWCKKDSLQRRAVLTKEGSISHRLNRCYPIAEWSRKEVLAYVKFNRLPLSPEYVIFNDQSFGSLDPNHLRIVKEKFPVDWERIKAQFPDIEANLLHDEINKKRGLISVVHNVRHSARTDKICSV